MSHFNPISAISLSQMLFKVLFYATSIAVVSTFACLGLPQGGADEANFVQVDEEPKIIFSFDQTPWLSVIELFADEADFALQPIDQPPPGSFSYLSKKEHTIAEAMDILNQALLREGYTLLRNERLLILQRDAELNPRLIETVKPEQLKERGKYEVLRCVFDMKGTENRGIEDSIRTLLSQRNMSGFHAFPAANMIIVQESGIILREINEIIEKSKQQAMADEPVLRNYKMKNVDPETLLTTVRDLMGFDADSNMSRDESIKISVEPLGDNLRILATERSWKEFLDIAEMVDVPAKELQGFQIERPYVKTYQPLHGPELAFQVLQTNLEGRDGVRMDQNPVDGAIVIMGRKTDHELAAQILGELSRNAPDYAFIQLQNADAEEVLGKLQLFFRQTTEEMSTDGPILFADSFTNEINVRGKPADVELVKKMVADMDSRTSFESGPRTDTRFVEMDPDQAEEMLGVMPHLFPSTGRQNKLEIVMPNDRGSFRRRGIIDYRNYRDQQPLAPQELEVPQDNTDRGLDDEGALLFDSDEYQFVSCPVPAGEYQDEDEDNGSGESSSESQHQSDYRPPTRQESVPGADVEVVWTPSGLKLVSKDLDALDDLEDLIKARLKKASKAGKPTVFPLVYRRVEDVKPFLDRIFGLAGGGGGGGGGGIGGAITNVLGNAMGNSAGDLLGGMFGSGGGGGGEGSLELEGDVFLDMDVKFNSLVVTNATQNDLVSIVDILDWLDQPEAPQDMAPAEKQYFIPIKFYDPFALQEIIEKQLPGLIESTDEGGGGGNQNAAAQQQRQLQQLMRAMGGGGRGRGQSSEAEQEKPTATLGVDERNNALLLTGPDYIYKRVMDIVRMVDVPQALQHWEVVPYDRPADSLLNSLSAILGENLEIVEREPSENGGTSSGGTRTRNTPRGPNVGSTSSNDAARRAAIQQQIQRAMQQGGGARGIQVLPGGGNRGGGNRGGGNRGGGNRGGGDRGGGRGSDRGGR